MDACATPSKELFIISVPVRASGKSTGSDSSSLRCGRGTAYGDELTIHCRKGSYWLLVGQELHRWQLVRSSSRQCWPRQRFVTSSSSVVSEKWRDML
jgi:hypothetical protein